MQILSVGEVMVELAPAGAGGKKNLMTLGFAGDTYNTAIYLARLGASVAYFTRLGDDPYSQQAVATMSAEGLNCAGVEYVAGRTPGLYMIANQANGERNFTFWRNQSPAREMFADEASLNAFKLQLKNASNVYFSGITLAILTEQARAILFALLTEYRRNGGHVIFDNNYRQALWQSQNHAQVAMQSALECADIALLTDDDYARLWGNAEFNQVLQRCKAAGVLEVVLKCGPNPVRIACRTTQTEYTTGEVPVPAVADVVDTTAAGDSFNAGYLYSRFNNISPAIAAGYGSRCARIVIQHRGAIVDRDEFLSGMRD
ncbi:MAG TPA: sugar kinase [Cellvibrionaceae bacterium]